MSVDAYRTQSTSMKKYILRIANIYTTSETTFAIEPLNYTSKAIHIIQKINDEEIGE